MRWCAAASTVRCTCEALRTIRCRVERRERKLLPLLELVAGHRCAPWDSATHWSLPLLCVVAALARLGTVLVRLDSGLEVGGDGGRREEGNVDTLESMDARLR